MLGMVVGLFARPHPWVAAKLQYVQLVTLQLARMHHLPMDFGAELDRLPATQAGVVHTPGPSVETQFLVMPVLWLCSLVLIGVCYWRRAELPPRTRTAVWSSLVCAAGFTAMTVGLSYRAVPLWTAFITLSVATILGLLVFSPEARRAGWFAAETRALVTAALAIVMVVLSWQMVDGYVIRRAWRAVPLGNFPAAGSWLRDHARPGDLVANVSWDTFTELYFWSPQCRYLYGMDPIFLYAQNPRMFWKIRHLNDRATAFTTDGPEYPAGARTDTYTFLHDEVGAKYVFLQVDRLPELDAYLASDPRFAQRFSGQEVRVYEVLPGGRVRSQKQEVKSKSNKTVFAWLALRL